MRDSDAERPAASLIAAGGVFLPGHLAEPIWRTLREDIARRQRDGGRVRPEVTQALEVLRAAAMAHLSAHGHDARTFTDARPQLPPTPLVTTADMATRLKVTERHARRIAHAEGVKPVARNLWDREDVAALVARRGGTPR
ncbi:hypothetical protein [Micromonospora sp. NPDC005413]|uniref:hypothetical protein n=1 Tax=Micromonospora sp. NPDC005413 TaxID=3154563 RepID=UPI0033A47FF9